MEWELIELLKGEFNKRFSFVGWQTRPYYGMITKFVAMGLQTHRYESHYNIFFLNPPKSHRLGWAVFCSLLHFHHPLDGSLLTCLRLKQIHTIGEVAHIQLCAVQGIWFTKLPRAAGLTATVKQFELQRLGFFEPHLYPQGLAHGIGVGVDFHLDAFSVFGTRQASIAAIDELEVNHSLVEH